jgi:F-type H+-transporting ATPase subunit delta
MIPGSLARRYARALLGLAESPSQRDKFAKDLEAFSELARTKDTVGTPLLSALVTERFPVSERKKLLDAVLRRVGAEAMVGKFLAYVLERGRLNGLAEIVRAYRRMADEAAGRIDAEIVSAAALPPDAIAKMKSALERATGKSVVTSTRVDPELIGGVVARVGSYVVDGSVRQALVHMKARLRA